MKIVLLCCIFLASFSSQPVSSTEIKAEENIESNEQSFVLNGIENEEAEDVDMWKKLTEYVQKMAKGRNEKNEEKDEDRNEENDEARDSFKESLKKAIEAMKKRASGRKESGGWKELMEIIKKHSSGRNEGNDEARDSFKESLKKAIEAMKKASGRKEI